LAGFERRDERGATIERHFAKIRRSIERTRAGNGFSRSWPIRPDCTAPEQRGTRRAKYSLLNIERLRQRECTAGGNDADAECKRKADALCPTNQDIGGSFVSAVVRSFSSAIRLLMQCISSFKLSKV
jgi:hypothetical protein